jgi:filamentous hemagglutinin family protein
MKSPSVIGTLQLSVGDVRQTPCRISRRSRLSVSGSQIMPPLSLLSRFCQSGWAVFSLSGLLLTGISTVSLANPIAADPTSTNSATQVTQSGQAFTITGGQRSGDGQTLFHSFEQFGLSADQVATFLAQPEVQSILGRVIGGDASYIDGLLRVAGSSADLYLINPAGILFGPNAQLDLSGSFAATTASGIAFDNGLFDASSNDYSQLTGAPNGYVFATNHGGALVNAANLAVTPGKSITLIGGQVISTGTLTAPGGTITIAAVPDASWVRISQANQVLNLELATVPDDAIAATTTLTPLSLPTLLTGGTVETATGLVVGPEGNITLVDSATEVAPVAGAAIISGNLDVSGPVGGDVTVVGDRVGLVTTTINASGENGGGTVRVGGDYEGQPTLPGSSLTVVDSGTHVTANGGLNGDGGRVILWSDGATVFEGAIAAEGGTLSGNGGFVEVSGAQTLVFQGEVDLTAPTGVTGELLLDPTDIVIRNGIADGNDTDALTNVLSEPIIALADAGPTEIFESELEGLAGNATVTLRASNSITLEDLTDNALTFQAGPGQISFEAGGAFTVADINDAIVAPQRSLIITANTITTGPLNTVDLAASGGPITLNGTGAISVAEIDTRGDQGGGGRGGDVNGTTAGPISIGNIDTTGDAMGPGSGNVTFTGSSIEARDINAGDGFNNDSRVTLTATTGDIIVDTIQAGGGGLAINAANRFQARDSFDAGVRIVLDAATDGALINFLMRGNPQPLIDANLVNTGDPVFITIPTSILVSPEASGGSIVINHGGAATTFSSGNITIQGSGANPLQQFVAGPNADHTIDIDPAGPVADFFGFTTLFPVGTFSDNASGTTGAILRGTGDATLVTSFQNQLFLPVDVNTTSLEQLSTEEGAVEVTAEDGTEVLAVEEAAGPDCEAPAVTVSEETVEIVDLCESLDNGNGDDEQADHQNTERQRPERQRSNRQESPTE